MIPTNDMPRVILQDFNLGGVADSQLQGLPNSLYRSVGLDLHSRPGFIRLSQALKKESATTITAGLLCKSMVVCSNGEVYAFSSTTGEVFRRTTAGAWASCYTVTPGAGAAGCLGAVEYKGYIIWATQSRLHRITIANAANATWTVLDVDWQTFTATDADFHPMIELNLNLYIGDAQNIAEWDGTTFTAAKLVINTPHRVSALGKSTDGYQLLVGTFISATTNRCKVYRWNTWSTNFTADDDIYEIGVNCFLPVDNIAVAQCGRVGNLYYYSADQWILWKRIPGDWDNGKTCIVYPGAAVNRNGQVMFGVSAITSGNNPVLQGVYEIGAYSQDYPKVITLKHLISSLNTTNLAIGSIGLVGDSLLVAYYDAVGGASGVDVTDALNRTGIGYFETRLINDERDRQKTVKVQVGLKSRPTGTGITLYYSTAGDGSYAQQDFEYDSERLLASATVDVPDAPVAMIKVEVVGPQTNTNATPEIDQVIIDY